MPRRTRAFTLPELLVTLAIIATLTSIALPAYSAFIEHQRTINLLTQLHTELQFARGSAISRNQPVTLCSGSDSCLQQRAWAQQILIFVDDNRNGSLDSDEQLLRAVDLPSSHTWNWSNFRQKPYMTFIANGATNSLNGTFTLCKGDQALASIIINRSGRARQSLLQAPTICPQ